MLSHCIGKPSRKSRYGNLEYIYKKIMVWFAHVTLVMVDLVCCFADLWVWAVYHQCHQHHLAAARCIAQTQMTCMLTLPAQCPLPAPPHSHQITHKGPHATDHHMVETRTEVSMVAGTHNTHHDLQHSNRGITNLLISKHMYKIGKDIYLFSCCSKFHAEVLFYGTILVTKVNWTSTHRIKNNIWSKES